MPLAYEGTTADAKPGETRSFVLDLKGVNGKKFLLQVADYAMMVDHLRGEHPDRRASACSGHDCV